MTTAAMSIGSLGESEATGGKPQLAENRRKQGVAKGGGLGRGGQECQGKGTRCGQPEGGYNNQSHLPAETVAMLVKP